MALTASSGCSKMENEHEIVQSDTDSRGSQSNDSGNELSVGGSSSEGGDSMSNHQNHNDNDDLVGNDQNHLHHHHHHGSFDGLKGFVTPSGNDNTTDRQIDFSSMPQPPPSAPPMLSSISPSSKSMFKALVGPMVPPLASSLFDTPASLLQSPQNLDVFSPSFGFSNQRQQQIFQCALCGNLAQLGLLQFMCAHKICQTCCQTTPSSNETKKVCGICGAGPAVITNFPPQMFLSPTNSVSPHGGNQFDGASNRGLSTQRNFSFSLNGIPVSPNLTSAAENCFSKMPIQPENEHLNPYTLKNIDSLSSSSMWTSLAPPPLALKNISNLNPKFENKDDIPVFSPLSPTNTSILPPQPLTSSPKEINSPKMPWAIAPPRPSLSSTSTATTVFQTTPHNQISVTPVTPPLLGSDINGSNNPFGSSMCQGCDGKPSSAFCLQCQETLCTHCIQAHQRVRATKSHRIVGLRDIFAHLIQQQQQQQQSQFSSPMQDDILCGNRTNTGSIGSLGDGHPSFGESESLSGDSSPRSSSVCGFHESKIVAICENCSHPLCAFCVSHHSNQHNIYPVGDIRQAINEMSNESCRLGWHCEETVDAISKIIDSVKSNAMTAENEIRTTIDSHIKALEERKTDLLNRLETAKNLKMSILSNQSEKLRSKRRDLTEAVIKAKAALETLPKEDEADMKSIFRQLSVLMRCVETMETSENRFQMLNVLMLSCQVNEDDKLKFLPPQDGTLLNKIRQFGNVESGPCAKTSTIMGDAYKKGIRDRQSVIYVQLRDACDDILPSSVAATQTNCLPLLPHQTKYEKTIPASDVQAVLIGPDGSPIETNITPRENGIVAISYLPYVEGNYQLTVLVKGTPINGCPAKIDIRRGRNYEDIASNGPILTFGKEGSGDGELCRPWGICVDLRGRVLVADRSNNRIQIFDKDGNFLSKFGTSGNRPGQFDRPAGITTNTKNHIIVADKDNHRIQVFDENGNFMLKFGDRGRAIGYFNYPWGVATNSHNAIAVSDTRNHRVQIFTEQGQFVRKCGFDSAYFFKNLDSPRGLCYLPDGQLLITDFNNHRLAVLSPRNMSEMKVYGCEGDVDGMFVRPQGVKIDSEGHILVCDSRNNRIQVFDSNDMRFIASFGLNPQTAQGFQMPTELAIPYSSLSGPFGAPAFSSTPTPLNQSPRQLLDRPTDIAVGPDGRIYVVDFGNNCIRVF